MKIIDSSKDNIETKENIVTESMLSRSIAVSIIGILVSMACLFGLTWAWFSDSSETVTQTMIASNFDLVITYYVESDSTCYKVDKGVCSLEKDKSYSFYFQALGDDTVSSKGYYKISVWENEDGAATVFYTDIITKAQAKAQKDSAFYFSVKGFVKIQFEPMWGDTTEIYTSSYKVASGGSYNAVALTGIKNTSLINPKDTEEETETETTIETETETETTEVETTETQVEVSTDTIEENNKETETTTESKDTTEVEKQTETTNPETEKN